MNYNSKLNITNSLSVSNTHKLTVTVINNTTGEAAKLNKGYVIGTIKGKGAENIVLNQTAHPGLKIENVKGKLVVA